MTTRVFLMSLSAVACCAVTSAAGNAPPLLLVERHDVPDGRVVRIPLDRDASDFEVLIEDVDLLDAGRSSFHCAASGRFIYLSRSGIWRAGNVRNGRATELIPSELVPAGVRYGAISNDGCRIVWVGSASDVDPHLALLFVTDLRSHVITERARQEGFILYPAWGPDSARLAYYSGSSDAAAVDGFRLMLLDVADAHAAPAEIAPPSLPTRLSPGRSRPPVWSPDGKALLFEAAYGRPDYKGGICFVSLSGKRTPQAVPCFAWYLDSTRLLTTLGFDDVKPDERQRLAIFSLNSAPGVTNPEGLPATVPARALLGPCTSDGTWVVYRTAEGGVYALDVNSGAARHLFDSTDKAGRLREHTFHWVKLLDRIEVRRGVGEPFSPVP